MALPNQLHNLPKHRMYCSSTYIIFVLGGIALHANAHTSYFETFYSLPDAGDYNQPARNALRMARYKWPDAVVPFAFQEDAYTALEQEAVRGAMASLSNSTCVQFVPKSEQHKHHIRFYKVMCSRFPTCCLLPNSQVRHSQMAVVRTSDTVTT